MFDLNTAVQTVLSPVVTIPVIAALAITIAAQAYFDARRAKNRLRVQAQRLGKMTGALLAAVSATLMSETDRQVDRAIEFTYDTMKAIGFAKLAEGKVTFEDIMFGGPLPEAESLRHRHGRDRPIPFSMDELKEALRPHAAPKADIFVDSHGGAHLFEEPVKNTGDEGAGFGGKGQRPYHKANTDRSPRAG